MMSMLTSQRLARNLLSVTCRDLPSSTLQSARRCLIDLFAAAAAGFQSQSATVLRNMACRREGAARLWYSHEKAAVEAAAMANSAAASALDLDDGHRWAGGHPGAAIIPSVLAISEISGGSLGDALTAMTVGYEASVRIAAARDFNRLYALSTGRWSAYGVVAAAGWLKSMQAEKLAQALVIAGELSPWLVGSGFSQFMGNHVKEGIPWSTHLGLMSLEMAIEGMTGPLDLFDNPEHYDADKVTRNFADVWRIDGVYFKPYACCRWIHTALDALSSLQEGARFSAEEIDSIEVHTVRRALTLNNHTEPASLESAQYSFPFCMALLACDGPGSLLRLHPRLLARRDVIALAGKVRMVIDPELDSRFPAQCPARVYVHFGTEVLSAQVDVPLGDPSRPLTDQDLVGKFLDLTCGALPENDVKTFCRSILSTENEMPVRELLDSIPLLPVAAEITPTRLLGGNHG
jgi:2-methylcitrate dehydratase PrpD